MGPAIRKCVPRPLRAYYGQWRPTTRSSHLPWHQILALATDGDTYRLRFGHRSRNQPCTPVGTNRCYITSQNHEYAVDDRTLSGDWVSWFINANDGTASRCSRRWGMRRLSI